MSPAQPNNHSTAADDVSDVLYLTKMPVFRFRFRFRLQAI